jgi:hypothetical protein
VPKAIVLQFVATPGLSSRLIEWYGHGWCCHVDTVLEDGRLLGAHEDGGVQIKPPDYERFLRRVRVELPAPDDVVDRYYAFVRDQVGKPYDNSVIAGFAAGRNWRDRDHWICSELPAAGFEPGVSGYLPFPLTTASNKITPPDLLLICSTRVFVG